MDYNPMFHDYDFLEDDEEEEPFDEPVWPVVKDGLAIAAFLFGLVALGFLLAKVLS